MYLLPSRYIMNVTHQRIRSKKIYNFNLPTIGILKEKPNDDV